MRANSPGTVVILCGGRGTRSQEHTQSIPKPLVEIGGRPILWHVMEIYACQGFRRFVLCLGYKGELIDEFVRDADWPEGTEFICVATGLETQTVGASNGSRSTSGTRRSVRPMPTVSPTLISRGCAPTTMRTLRSRR
jgi:hypothetical protein